MLVASLSVVLLQQDINRSLERLSLKMFMYKHIQILCFEARSSRKYALYCYITKCHEILQVCFSAIDKGIINQITNNY